ncbi:protein MAIN-LIKE 2-like [Camellia sinensis]|uniref:protein MAIN-LIKE 2-like n=1 Tax=Camellia sinensis TaxID=4442 RepID=UPI0010358974|nr:protein MAIN-LIKE 2-like [Camellia sinensis]
MELPDDVRYIVDGAGFGIFCMGLSRLTASRPLLGALVERWWDTTDFFLLSTSGEMTMTPFDFSMLIGIGVRGDPIPFDTDMGKWDAVQIFLLGTRRPPFSRLGFVRYSWFADQFRGQTPTIREEVEHYAWGFLMFMLGTTLFADRGNTIGLYLLSALINVTRIRRYDWGSAGLATLYGYMSSSSRRSGHLLGGYWRAWELWVYAYFLRLAP